MEKIGNWEIIKPLGEGGQGKVYLVRNCKQLDFSKELSNIGNDIRELSVAVKEKEKVQKHSESFVRALRQIFDSENPLNLGAMKQLHKTEETSENSKAKTRMKKEIEALKSIKHPNIIEILDDNIQDGWFVGKYFPKGPISKHRELFQGRLLFCLQALRPLIHAVSAMHKADLIHRDIKPENIFISDNGQLVLGDLGLIFYADGRHTRVSSTLENVGSRDWMPQWAMGMRVEKIGPTFDIFCLGKLLWSMISGKPILRLWYWQKEEFNVEKIFPKNPKIKWTRKIFEQCIVEDEKDCLKTADDLLEIVDTFIYLIQRNADIVEDGLERRCKVCGLGEYKYVVNENGTDAYNFGIRPTGNKTFKIFACDHCGNVQMFYIDREKRPEAWRNSGKPL